MRTDACASIPPSSPWGLCRRTKGRRVHRAQPAGRTRRRGKVADGSTTTDWDEEEIARKISINTGVAYAEWRAPAETGGNAQEETKINLLDTPGYSTFVNETKSSLIAADAAL